MTEINTRDLMAAMAAEMADIRAEIESAGELVAEVLRQLPAETRLGYLTRSQCFDVLTQRVAALGSLAQAVANDQPMDTALAALPLAEMAERMQETALRARPGISATSDLAAGKIARAAGELQLF